MVDCFKIDWTKANSLGLKERAEYFDNLAGLIYKYSKENVSEENLAEVTVDGIQCKVASEYKETFLRCYKEYDIALSLSKRVESKSLEERVEYFDSIIKNIDKMPKINTGAITFNGKNYNIDKKYAQLFIACCREFRRDSKLLKIQNLKPIEIDWEKDKNSSMLDRQAYHMEVIDKIINREVIDEGTTYYYNGQYHKINKIDEKNFKYCESIVNGIKNKIRAEEELNKRLAEAERILKSQEETEEKVINPFEEIANKFKEIKDKAKSFKVIKSKKAKKKSLKVAAAVGVASIIGITSFIAVINGKNKTITANAYQDINNQDTLEATIENEEDTSKTVVGNIDIVELINNVNEQSSVIDNNILSENINDISVNGNLNDSKSFQDSIIENNDILVYVDGLTEEEVDNKEKTNDSEISINNLNYDTINVVNETTEKIISSTDIKVNNSIETSNDVSSEPEHETEIETMTVDEVETETEIEDEITTESETEIETKIVDESEEIFEAESVIESEAVFETEVVLESESFVETDAVMMTEESTDTDVVLESEAVNETDVVIMTEENTDTEVVSEIESVDSADVANTDEIAETEDTVEALKAYYDYISENVLNEENSQESTINIPSNVYQSGITKNYTNYDYFYTKWSKNTSQRVLADQWDAAGRTSNNGIATLDDRYLVAVSPKFGTVGDNIDVVLEDGTVINCIIGDAKGGDATSEWGHKLGNGAVDVIEWESMGNQSVITIDDWKGKEVASIVNKGRRI